MTYKNLESINYDISSNKDKKNEDYLSNFNSINYEKDTNKHELSIIDIKLDIRNLNPRKQSLGDKFKIIEIKKKSQKKEVK